MENKSKLNTVLLVIIIILSIIVYIFVSGIWQKRVNILLNNSQLNNQNQEEMVKQNEKRILIENIVKNNLLYKDKLITVQGYIYTNDIKSEIVRGNLYLNLRDRASMEGSQIISMKIESESIRQMLVDSYGDSDVEWVKVEVTGKLSVIVLPLNGTSDQDEYIEVTNLNYYSNNNLREKGETCGENIGDCRVGLKCAYPCGIQGCQNVCMGLDELSKP